jgi:hypothetical protein
LITQLQVSLISVRMEHQEIISTHQVSPSLVPTSLGLTTVVAVADTTAIVEVALMNAPRKVLALDLQILRILTAMRERLHQTHTATMVPTMDCSTIPDAEVREAGEVVEDVEDVEVGTDTDTDTDTVPMVSLSSEAQAELI